MMKEAQDESLSSEDLCSPRQEGWSITCPGSAACIAYSSTAWTASPSTLILTQKCAQTLLFFHTGILWRKRDTSHGAKISLFYSVHPFQTELPHYSHPIVRTPNFPKCPVQLKCDNKCSHHLQVFFFFFLSRWGNTPENIMSWKHRQTKIVTQKNKLYFSASSLWTGHKKAIERKIQCTKSFLIWVILLRKLCNFLIKL